jgi:hypothetical protein
MKMHTYHAVEAMFKEVGCEVGEPALHNDGSVSAFDISGPDGWVGEINDATTIGELNIALERYRNPFEDIAITKTSELSGIRRTMTIKMRFADYRRWQEGALIQNALPYLTADQREFLMTGITADEWDDLFGERPAEEGTTNGA